MHLPIKERRRVDKNKRERQRLHKNPQKGTRKLNQRRQA
jgi:hypothetical protein